MTRIHRERWGSGEKRVLFLHGWGCSGALMKSAADALATGASVMTLDFPGFGESDRPPEPWGVPEYAEAVRELLIEENFIPCSVVAHSFGGRITLWLASEYPDLFEKIVITGGAGIRKPQTEEAKRGPKNSNARKRSGRRSRVSNRFPAWPGKRRKSSGSNTVPRTTTRWTKRCARPS